METVENILGTRKPIGIAEVRNWAVVMVGFAYWANILRNSGADGALSLASVVNNVLDNGAFDVFAWGIVLIRCWSRNNDRPASFANVMVTFMLGAIVLAPVRLASAAAVTLLGLLLFSGPEISRPLRQMRLVLFALAFETVWTTSVFAPLHVAFASVDARITAVLLRALGQTAIQHGNVVQNLSAQFDIVIWRYCSSLFPLADVLLAFVVIVLYRGCEPRLAQLPWLALSFLASIVLTEIRLVLLASNEASYHWWHFGPGMSVYTLAALGLAVLAPVLATRRPAEAVGTPMARAAT